MDIGDVQITNIQDVVIMNIEDVPMMFRSQIHPRCQIHRVEKNKTRQDADKWVDNWKKVFPQDLVSNEQPQKSNQFPSPRVQRGKTSVRVHSSNTNNNNLALARPKKNVVTTSIQRTDFIPKFGNHVETKEYTIRWRLVTNSGQDEGVIRPIIGAKGFPYYSGASMKGAFLRACKQINITSGEFERYLGKKLEDGSYKSGTLRFHGAYPIDIDWTKHLVDIIHCQDEKQVIKDKTTNANAQISLYQVKLRFGISSFQELQNSQWNRIWEIWEYAISNGLGSRVSAGYGQFRDVNSSNKILEIDLHGQGATSKLVDGTKEFRPNIFKAALRGHTLRLLGGLTDIDTAKKITREFWGGFQGKNAVIGLLGIGFNYQNHDISFEKEQQFYQLNKGNLSILYMHNILDKQSLKIAKLVELSRELLKFAILFGGFGKSWRRVCHKKFNPEYFKKTQKPVIGCHWELGVSSKSFYLPVNQLSDIAVFIDYMQNIIKDWIPINKQHRQGTEFWRESWYSPKVEVWGHLAEDGKSKALPWFHSNYSDGKSIKNPHPLSGSMGNTGRIWHRMYPRYVINDNNEIIPGKGYVELLTIFKNASSDEDFLTFLKKKEISGFEKIY